MNEIVNKILLSGDKLMPEMHLSFKKKEKNQRQNKEKSTKIQISKRFTIYLSNRICFQHDMAYGDFRDLSRKTASDKLLRHKVFNIAENLKYDGSQRGIAPMVDNFFHKKSPGANISATHLWSET